jgi:HD-like signal output (HDOD) protein
MTTGQAATIDLKRILAGAQLPALPQSAIRLLELSQGLANGPQEFAVPIESDPGLAGQVLRFVNSSYFGFAREISTIKKAIAMVGIRTIKNFALWSAVFSLMPNPKCGSLDLKPLWQDSLRRGLLARTLARIFAAKEPEEAFSAALLQDMAVPLLAKELLATYGKLLKAREEGKHRLSCLEERTFGWSHADAGALMARHWNLPEKFALLIEGHTAIDRWTTSADADPECLAVALSALLPPLADPVWLDSAKFESCYGHVAPSGSPSTLDLLKQTDQEFNDFAPVLKLAVPGKSLVEAYEEITAAAS